MPRSTIIHYHPVEIKSDRSALRRGTATAESTVCLMSARIIQVQRECEGSRLADDMSLRGDSIRVGAKARRDIPSCSPRANHKMRDSINHASILL